MKYASAVKQPLALGRTDIIIEKRNLTACARMSSRIDPSPLGLNLIPHQFQVDTISQQWLGALLHGSYHQVSKCAGLETLSPKCEKL